MVVALFTRGLCCLLAVDEARYREERKEAESSYPILPVLVFDAPVLLTLIASVDMAISQLRSFLAAKDLQRRGIIRGKTDSNREQFLANEQDLYDMFECCRNTWIGYPTLNRRTAGRYGRLLSFLICTTYVALHGITFAFSEGKETRNQRRESFFIVVDLVVAFLLVVTACAEQSSGALFISPGSNRPSSVNSSSVRESDAMERQREVDFTLKTYRNKHLLLFITVFIFLLLRTGCAIVFADQDSYDQFTQPYKYLIVELGVELLFYITFFGLVIAATNFYKDNPERPTNPIDPLYLADVSTF